MYVEITLALEKNIKHFLLENLHLLVVYQRSTLQEPHTKISQMSQGCRKYPHTVQNLLRDGIMNARSLNIKSFNSFHAPPIKKTGSKFHIFFPTFIVAMKMMPTKVIIHLEYPNSLKKKAKYRNSEHHFFFFAFTAIFNFISSSESAPSFFFFAFLTLSLRASMSIFVSEEATQLK